MRIRYTILYILLLISFMGVKAQDMPSTCAGSWERYVATPDPLYKAMGMGSSHFEWILDGIDTAVYYGAGNDSIKVQWNQPGTYKIGIREISEYGCAGDTVWADIKVNSVEVNLADVEVNEEDTYNLTPTGDTPFNKTIWNNLTESASYSGIAKNTETVVVQIFKDYTTGRTCQNSDTALLTVHPLPRFEISNNGNPVNDSTLCNNDSIVISAGNLTNVEYLWSTGSTSSSITVNALPVGTPLSEKEYWVQVTNEFGGKYRDTFYVFRCPGYSISLGSLTNAFPKTRGSNGKYASFAVQVVNATVAADDSLTVWYVVAEDDTAATQVTLEQGLDSGTIEVTGRDFEKYFNEDHDVQRTIIVKQIKIGSLDAIIYSPSLEPSGKFFIIHKPKVKDLKYKP